MISDKKLEILLRICVLLRERSGNYYKSVIRLGSFLKVHVVLGGRVNEREGCS